MTADELEPEPAEDPTRTELYGGAWANVEVRRAVSAALGAR